jgi:spore maturation protein CgeB
MKVLYIAANIENDSSVREDLDRLSCQVQDFPAPDDGQRGAGEYAAGLLKEIEAFSPDVVLSLKYFPTVSIVCKAAGVNYGAWICSSYDPGIYSCTMLEECNYVFFADYSLYQEFAEGGFPHVYYLPLGADTGKIRSTEEKAGEYTADLTMMQDIYPRKETGYHPLSADSPLKDATRGYLEGCIACQHQICGLPSMAEHLPGYVWEDLTANFVPETGVDSIEAAAHYYDYRYFNDLITYADRDIHLHTMAKNEHFTRVVLYDHCESYTSEEVECRKWRDMHSQLPVIAADSRINLVITHRNWKSAVPQISWDIMAAGGFLLSNIQGDFFRLFPDKLPILYEDERDMLSKGIYYLHHDEERESLACELAEEVRAKHTCLHRLKELFSVISNGNTTGD